MSTDFFNRMKISPLTEFDRFKLMLEEMLTHLAANLYWVTVFFEEQSKERPKVKVFMEKFENFRTVIFNCRSSVQNSKNLEDLSKAAISSHEELIKLKDDLFFTFACIEEKDKWIVNIDITRHVGGMLGGPWMHEYYGALNILDAVPKTK